jgi:hypothetical protein
MKPEESKLIGANTGNSFTPNPSRGSRAKSACGSASGIRAHSRNSRQNSGLKFMSIRVHSWLKQFEKTPMNPAKSNLIGANTGNSFTPNPGRGSRAKSACESVSGIRVHSRNSRQNSGLKFMSIRGALNSEESRRIQPDPTEDNEPRSF